MDTTASTRWAALLLGLMMILVPAFGVPSQEMLQDTLKSIIVAGMACGTAIVFFALQMRSPQILRFHGVLWLPLLLCMYAIGSMAWSHPYLAGMEAARWFLFALLLWLAMQAFASNYAERILWGIHWGVTIASIWTAAQFWADLPLFAQGPAPASTFVNRNFFAEYALCALPYSTYLLLQTRDPRETYALAAGIGFNVAALMMTGTRSVLVALMLFALLAPVVLWRFWPALGVAAWGRKRRIAALALVLGSTVFFGSIPTGSPKIRAEIGTLSAIERALQRTSSVATSQEYTKGSFALRSKMWGATVRMATANPIAGVGAGAWEVEIPPFQEPGDLTETDFYAHNEFLQLIAEYGLTGWLFLVLLLSYLAISAWKTWHWRSDSPNSGGPLRAAALGSLFLLLLVSNAGFPWRLAGTGALFALGLGLLVGTNSNYKGFTARTITLGSRSLTTAIVAFSAMLVIVAAVSYRAAMAERALVRSTQIALTINASQDARNPRWVGAKAQAWSLVSEGMTLNPHYRKLTGPIGDEFARWGDWTHALAIWESVLQSRPHVVALICNVGRAHLELGRLREARHYFDKAVQLQPTAVPVLALEVSLLMREGKPQAANVAVQRLLHQPDADFNVVRLAYAVGKQTRDWPLMIAALQLAIERWPTEVVEAHLKLGDLYADPDRANNRLLALESYRSALQATPESYKAQMKQRIPLAFQKELGLSL